MRRTHLAIPFLMFGLSALLLAACGDATDGGQNGLPDGVTPDGVTNPDMVSGMDTMPTDLPPGAACTAATQCSGGQSCVGSGDGQGFVCGEANAGGHVAGESCASHDECELNACVAGICEAPRPTGVIVGTGGTCNWLDSPESCLDWNCLYEAGVTVCRHNDQGVPNGNVTWDCNDVNNGTEVQTVCTSTGQVPTTDPSWDCSYAAETDTTVCVIDADLPDAGDPGNNGGSDFDWTCEFPDGGDGSVKICEREGGGPTTGCPSGNIEGLACTPNGAAVSGATVTIHYTDCSGEPAERTVESDALGYWSFGSIPAGSWTLDITKGPYSTEQQVEVVADQTTSMTDGNQRACFEPQNTKIAVVGGAYDDIGSVLTELGFTFDYYNGIGSFDGWNFLLDASLVDQYDIIFINCGVYPESEFAARMSELQSIGTNLRNFVDTGHYLYTSDWAYYFLEAAYPDKVDFRGEDLTAVDVLIGEVGEHAVAVTDAELAAYTNLSTALITLDLPSWAVAVGSAADTKTYLRGDARLRNGEVLTNVPFLVDFRSGSGSAVYTSYHIHSNDAVNAFFAFLALNFK